MEDIMEAEKKTIVAAVAFAALIGAIAIVGYQVSKELSKSVNEIDWDNITL
jgi:hypothetical protein